MRRPIGCFVVHRPSYLSAGPVLCLQVCPQFKEVNSLVPLQVKPLNEIKPCLVLWPESRAMGGVL